MTLGIEMSMELIPKPFILVNVIRREYISGTLDREGYAEWLPVLQDEPIMFEDLESELGFKIHPDIKQYFTTYWFMRLVGNRGNEQYCLESIEPNIDIIELVR